MSHGAPGSLVLLLLAAACGGEDDVSAGVRAYRDGRFRDALRHLTAAEHAAGHGAPASLVYGRGLAALRAGELRVAEFSAEKAAARGGAGRAAARDFLLGHVAFARCAHAKAEASLQEADPTALPRALAHAESALRWWRRAATSADDWPAARRNAERALLEVRALRQAAREAEQARRARRERAPDVQPADTPPDASEAEQPPVPQPIAGALSADDLRGVLELLARKEEEKRQVRRARQRARTADVEQDW